VRGRTPRRPTLDCTDAPLLRAIAGSGSLPCYYSGPLCSDRPGDHRRVAEADGSRLDAVRWVGRMFRLAEHARIQNGPFESVDKASDRRPSRTGEPSMIRNLLIGLDGSADSNAVSQLGIAWAKRSPSPDLWPTLEIRSNDLMSAQPLLGLSAREVEKRHRRGQSNRPSRPDDLQYASIGFQDMFTLFNVPSCRQRSSSQSCMIPVARLQSVVWRSPSRLIRAVRSRSSPAK
jgi:hypothetical protein